MDNRILFKLYYPVFVCQSNCNQLSSLLLLLLVLILQLFIATINLFNPLIGFWSLIVMIEINKDIEIYFSLINRIYYLLILSIQTRKTYFFWTFESFVYLNVSFRLFHRFNGSRPDTLDEGSLYQEITRALDLWSAHSKLDFHRSRAIDADIIISFFSRDHGDNMSFDGRGNVLAHAFFPGPGLGGDAHFDADEKWIRSGIKDPDGKLISSDN